jgi:hypothetical protein
MKSGTTNSAAKIIESKSTYIFDSVHKFYIAVVGKIIKIFPFHDDVFRGLAVPRLWELYRRGLKPLAGLAKLDRSQGRDQTKPSTWSSRLWVGRGANNPTL